MFLRESSQYGKQIGRMTEELVKKILER